MDDVFPFPKRLKLTVKYFRFSVKFVLFYQVEIVVLREEGELLSQEGQEPDQVVVLSSLRGSLILRAPMPSLTKKKLKRNYNKNYMII